MVIETSALGAILLREPEREEFLQKMSQAKRRLLSAVSLTEIGVVLINRDGADALEQGMASFLRKALVTIVPVDEVQATMAMEAYRLYGRGRHPAKLNLGDCFPYALAKVTGDSLLFKGNDFSQTDIRRA